MTQCVCKGSEWVEAGHVSVVDVSLCNIHSGGVEPFTFKFDRLMECRRNKNCTQKRYCIDIGKKTKGKRQLIKMAHMPKARSQYVAVYRSTVPLNVCRLGLLPNQARKQWV